MALVDAHHLEAPAMAVARQGLELAGTAIVAVAAPELDAFADGTMDFGKETVDMNVLTRLPEYKGVLPEWWSDENGKAAIGFRTRLGRSWISSILPSPS